MRPIRKQPYRARITEDMLAKTHKIVVALRELQNQGLAVTEITCGAGQPVIEVLPCHRLDQLISAGQAATGDIFIRGGGVARHQCWTTIGGCRVVWSADGYPVYAQR